MTNNIVGNSVIRFDAVAKVTGKAKYVDDFFVNDMLVGKVLRSPHAHAIIKDIDTSNAKKLEGVEAVITHEDLPKIKFATAGHPWSLDPSHRDIDDRLILTNKARFVGDAIAAVIAVDEIVAAKALELIDVDYEVLEPIVDSEDALKENAPIIHEERPNNILSSFGSEIGNVEEDLKKADRIFEGNFETSIVQHCHMENHSTYAYVDGEDRIVIVSSTQIPHIVRRIVGQALGIQWGKIKVIKPYIGGGFGNKQDVVIEPLTAAMSLAVDGRPVRYTLDREECFIDTRTRHSMKIKFKTAVSKEGKLISLDIKNLINNGAYASHGHSVALSAGGKFRGVYDFNSIKYSPTTVYTNLPAAGAMRGYGAPQMCYALESHIEDICRELNMDSIEFRTKNFISEGYVEPLSKNVVRAFALPECIEKGKELIKWDEKKKEYKNQSGDKRKGVGMACFSYFTGTHPVALEPAGARIVMNQDGSVQLQIGATEIGQGSDTVFGQMVAEILGLRIDMVHVISNQDTDITPFDTGSYASRQTFVSGAAVKKCALEVKDKVLAFASSKCGLEASELDIEDCKIVEKRLGRVICPLEEIAMESYYDRIKCCPITSDTSVNVRVNSIAYGATFAAVEVDIKTGKIEVLEIYNIHDSGMIMNPMLAEGQVHGGVSMGLGYALSEQMLFDKKTGKPLNNNLLDYKLQTIMDTPTIGSAFVEKYEPAGGFGQKSIGENTTVSPAPAIRNAVLDATGVAFNKIPMNPQSVFEKFKEVGLV
ncbi:xanthine dehydrogenase molybdenum-binding subunit XdhA [Clostridium botulinum]|uniref:xanthine dehydrogenase molybdenum-binding subunit XdhA n=1 Tax=unclassified Clostridium TaxID=2614128 RepID=UPI000503807A|nr:MULTISPECIES: xanthine dehydrogenase molybdenum-binding subunit XdhA [unclassified Clostridium]AIY78986.1 molybdopterin-binding domain of aldehyde dehydrogenase family protein [Clostridium botulinum 202F]KAI3346360.1 xanthine dehydrogenase molybdenum-binding subunit XdhA [Clostridium botulinum]KFX54253.1 xanthine dehydrogenase [Clostridium botulinum]KON13127.1 xanthine dehydrogenase [Clostridium botulinum]MBY6779576.1 xanthine dehydrogenase molybdenum-binding subunit XdhA [Clostridium botul